MPSDKKLCYDDMSDPNINTKTCIGCLAEYGGPAFPYVVLGGFRNGEPENVTDESLYMNSTALVLTFLVKNHQNKSGLAPAKDWEKK